MIDAYAGAGFTKLHLDTSMGCAGEPVASRRRNHRRPRRRTCGRRRGGGRACGRRAAGLHHRHRSAGAGRRARGARPSARSPSPEARCAPSRSTARPLSRAGLDAAFARAVGVVVQPGVEFGNAESSPMRRRRRRALVAVLDRMPQFVFEAHSTDYQPAAALGALVRDGFAILKVGPWLTFALREALYGLEPHRRRAGAGPLARKPAGGDGTHHAGGSPTIGANTIRARRTEQRVAAAFLLQRPHPLLLAGRRTRSARPRRCSRRWASARSPAP